MKLSIITINLNNKPGLEKTLQSVFSQSFRDFEYIVIDGASIDGSVEIIKRNEDKLNYWLSENDTGIYNAMNKGIKVAKGNYCLFLNSGDYFCSETVLEDAFKIDFKEDIVYGVQIVVVNEAIKKSNFLDPQYITLQSFINSTLPHQCTFIKRLLFEKIGLYNEQNQIVSDWEFNLKALFIYNCSLRKIPVSISLFDTKGISNNESFSAKHQKEKEEALKRVFPRIYPDYMNFKRIYNRYLRIPKLVRKAFNLRNNL
ncbi:MAG: glycosyltransferase family 2 protein [Bacteroidota bacterium]